MSMSQRSIAAYTTRRPYDSTPFRSHARSTSSATRSSLRGVPPEAIYEDQASGKRDNRPGLDACLKALRGEDTLIVWKLDRLGRDLRHLVNVVQVLSDRARLDRASAFADIAEAQAKAGDASGAAQSLSDAWAAARGVKDEFWRARAIANIAEVLVTLANDAPAARKQ